MATFARSAINEFSTANPAYIGATISIFLADSEGGKTSTLATLYEAPTGSNTLPNPQTLDSTGKFIRPVYIEQNVVIEASLEGVPSHDTGLIQVPMVNSYEVYTFDGDGTTTDFNLANVSVEAPNSLEVVLDGAQQEVDADYSWDFDTKTLTFSTPPGNNVRIVVVDRGLLRDLNQPSGGSVNLNSLAQDTLDRLDEFLEKSENLGDLDDVPTARNNLGLGTAATEDIQTSPDDATPGRLMRVGAFGLNDNLGTAAFKNAQESGTDYTAQRLLLTDSVADQPGHGDPSDVAGLARLDRLAAAGYIGAGWRRIETRSVGAGVASVQFVVPTGFEMFRFTISGWRRSGAINLLCRFSYDNSVSYDAGVSDYGFGSDFTAGGGSITTSRVALSTLLKGVTSFNLSLQGEYLLFAGASDLRATIFGAYTGFTDAAALGIVGQFGGSRFRTGRITHVRFYSDQGDVLARLITMEGAKA